MSLSTWKEVKMRTMRADKMIKTTGGKTMVQTLGLIDLPGDSLPH